MPRILVLGAGFGGLTAAADLRRRLPRAEIVLVDAMPSFRMGLAKLWALDGRRPIAAGTRTYDALRAPGIVQVRGTVDRIDAAARTVVVDGRPFEADAVVIALGAEQAPSLLPGFEEHQRAGRAFDLYDDAGVTRLHSELEAWRAGRILVLIPSLPFKCPPAPYEAALLVEAMLRRRGVRGATSLALATPEPHPMPVAPREYGGRLVPLLEAAGIAYHPLHKAKAVGPDVVEFDNGATLPYDLLVAVPPHRAPAVVREAGLTNETGWIPVDAATCATKHPGVYAVGDVVAIKLANGKLVPKAGVLAEAQAKAAASAIAAQWPAGVAAAGSRGASGDGVGAVEPFAGRGQCFIELGDGTAMAAQGDFFHQPEPRFEFGAPSVDGLGRKQAFERERLDAWFQ